MTIGQCIQLPEVVFFCLLASWSICNFCLGIMRLKEVLIKMIAAMSAAIQVDELVVTLLLLLFHYYWLLSPLLYLARTASP